MVVIIVTSPWIKFNFTKFSNRFRKNNKDNMKENVTHTSVDRESGSMSICNGLREPLLDDDAWSHSSSPIVNQQLQRERIRERMKMVSHSIVESPREEEEVQEYLRGAEGDVFQEGDKYRTHSVSSQSWLSDETISYDEENLL